MALQNLLSTQNNLDQEKKKKALQNIMQQQQSSSAAQPDQSSQVNPLQQTQPIAEEPTLQPQVAPEVESAQNQTRYKQPVQEKPLTAIYTPGNLYSALNPLSPEKAKLIQNYLYAGEEMDNDAKFNSIMGVVKDLTPDAQQRISQAVKEYLSKQPTAQQAQQAIRG
jgi:hypothetical protein